MPFLTYICSWKCWSIPCRHGQGQNVVLEFHSLAIGWLDSIWIRCWCLPSGSLLHYGLDREDFWGRFKALLCNYFWFGSKNTKWARVSWDDCTMPKEVVGWVLLPIGSYKNAHEQVIIHAFFLGQSNLQLLSIYHITQLQPSCHGLWDSSSHWWLSPDLSIKGGSKVWHHIAQSWKVMVQTVSFLPPSCSEDILQLNLWWKT